ncbi:acetyl esterase/lipase [Sphingomonas kaistensis]|uniref:Acetyl esterase/lipase n=1 Tax=Sphingomonas kaistensis TaxID=298708 RepID=A0A7X5Y628_9SPHN|nr:alpha/beta hydrolase [Sphingomonas kaistensis]NJC05282.1 acetyl esterase/lipase [Sphingomonas kaistensis]
MGRARIGLMVLAVAALVAGSGAWGQRARLAAECRTPALRQCLLAGSERGKCLAEAMQSLPDSCRKAMSERAAARAGALPAGWREEAYGSDPRQKLDWVAPAAGGKAPLLLFVHGGGWSIGDKRMGAGEKGAHFSGKGWAFASTNYRLVPQARVEDQAADVAAAIAYLRRQPGIDPNRIVLMGHSAGAHLAALVASDPAYLKAAGVPLGAVRGVVLLDGAGYDVGEQMAEPRNAVQSMYAQAFGTDPARQAALSPARHAAAPNAADWLILPVASRRDSTAQSEKLARLLREGGSRATVAPQAGKTHASLNRELGTAGDPSTDAVDAFLARL